MSASGSANPAETSSKRSSSALVAATPSMTLPSTSLFGIELRLLRQKADAGAVGRPGLAGEIVIEPGHDAQQRRFAGAVDPEHADLGARQERQRDVLEDLLAAREDLGQAVHHVDVLITRQVSDFPCCFCRFSAVQELCRQAAGASLRAPIPLRTANSYTGPAGGAMAATNCNAPSPQSPARRFDQRPQRAGSPRLDQVSEPELN